MVQTEQDLKPEFRLKVAEWEVRKAMIGATKPEPKRVEDTEIDKIKKLMPGETHDANYLICKFLQYYWGLYGLWKGGDKKKEKMRTTFYDDKTQGIPTLYRLKEPSWLGGVFCPKPKTPI